MTGASGQGVFTLAQRVLGTLVGNTSPNHNSNSEGRKPTFYCIGTLGPLSGEAEKDEWGLGCSG